MSRIKGAIRRSGRQTGRGKLSEQRQAREVGQANEWKRFGRPIESRQCGQSPRPMGEGEGGRVAEASKKQLTYAAGEAKGGIASATSEEGRGVTRVSPRHKRADRNQDGDREIRR